MDDRLITYSLDEQADEMFEIYLGRDPALRRIQLSRAPPPRDADIEELFEITRTIPASYHLMREAHAYQLDNLCRKLNDVIDGTNQVSCKFINGCMKIFAHSRGARLKISELAGSITAGENYHHGEASLQDVIVRRGFIAPGGMQLPFLLPSGNFGTRNEGGKDRAQARYLFARYNAHTNGALFREDDYPLLTFRYDEGQRREPAHFMPIIPLAIVETIEVPAHGWNIRVWAREVTDIIANLRRLISANGCVALIKMRPCCYPTGAPPRARCAPWGLTETERVICDCTDAAAYNWHGYVIERINGGKCETWAIGTYVWTKRDTVTITELPLGVWSQPYASDMQKMEDVAGSIVKSSWYAPNADGVSITITFDTTSARFAQLGIVCGAQQPMPPSIDDPVICALHLRARMADNLNFIAPDDSVRSFDSYEDVLTYWFPMRRDFFAFRIARMRELIAMRVLLLDNIVKYIGMVLRGEFAIARMTNEETERELAAHGFDRLYSAILSSPELKYEAHVELCVRDRARASYDYILDLHERDMTTDSCAKYEERARALREQLAQLDIDAAPGPGMPFIGARIWVRELDELERVIIEGRRTQWKFEDAGRCSFQDK